MRIERISGAILILLSGVLLLMAAYGGTPEATTAQPLCGCSAGSGLI